VLRNEEGLPVRVSLAAVNWSMRPPGYCGIYPQCGFAVFFVDDEQVARVAALVADLPFAAVPSPTADHTIRIELHDDNDRIANDDRGAPLTASIQIHTVAPADAAQCGGGDGGPDAPVDAPIETSADVMRDVPGDLQTDRAQDSAQETGAEAQADAASAEDAVDAGVGDEEVDSSDGVDQGLDAVGEPVDASAE